MKHLYTQLLAALFCLLSFTVSAQQGTDGFWGFSFLTKKAPLKKYFADNGMQPVMNTEEVLAFQNVQLEDVHADILIFNFYKGAFYRGIISINCPNANALIDGYFWWKKRLEAKYGAPVKVQQQRPDYLIGNDVDSLMDVALKNGEAKFSTFWKTTDVRTGRDSNIILAITKEKVLAITVSDSELLYKKIE